MSLDVAFRVPMNVCPLPGPALFLGQGGGRNPLQKLVKAVKMPCQASSAAISDAVRGPARRRSARPPTPLYTRRRPLLQRAPRCDAPSPFPGHSPCPRGAGRGRPCAPPLPIRPPPFQPIDCAAWLYSVLHLVCVACEWRVAGALGVRVSCIV